MMFLRLLRRRLGLRSVKVQIIALMGATLAVSAPTVHAQEQEERDPITILGFKLNAPLEESQVEIKESPGPDV